jgi:CRISPR-associated protein Cas1
VILSGHGFPIARLATATPGTVALRQNQYRAQGDGVAVQLAKSFALAKMNNQRVLLGSLARNRAETKPQVSRLLEEDGRLIGELMRRLEGYDHAEGGWRGGVMGLEAEAAEAYWHGIKLVLEGMADFPGRRKRFDEPKDPVNMLLNYGYSFLGATVWLAVEQVTTLGKPSLLDALDFDFVYS